MKKLVLVLVCTLIMAIFIGFNYLLWDKENREKDLENLQSSNEYNSATINALSREIKQLDDENKSLNAKISELEFNNRILNVNNQNLTQENTKVKDSLTEKINVIYGLKKDVDLSPLEQTIRKWAESINNGDYQTAYSLLHSKYIARHENISNIFKFTELFKDSIEKMELQSIKLYGFEMSEEEKGNIVFDVTVNVKLTSEDKSAEADFEEGANRCFFTVIYDGQNEKWIISNLLVL